MPDVHNLFNSTNTIYQQWWINSSFQTEIFIVINFCCQRKMKEILLIHTHIDKEYFILCSNAVWQCVQFLNRFFFRRWKKLCTCGMMKVLIELLNRNFCSFALDYHINWIKYVLTSKVNWVIKQVNMSNFVTLSNYRKVDPMSASMECYCREKKIPVN